MSDPFSSLEAVDIDGAIQEAGSRVDEQTRASFLRKAGIGLGALAGSGAILGALPSLASAAATSDVDILNFALTLEYLESAFYGESVMKGALSGETKTFAKVVAGHEAAHVAALKGALGSAAVAKPKFDFQGTTDDQAKFQATSEVLEYTGVSAYLGQVGNISSKKVLGAAGSILPVEAWHAAWISDLRRHGGKPYPAPMAFAVGKTMTQILAAVKGTGFIVG
jgi:Ferritin-like domain